MLLGWTSAATNLGVWARRPRCRAGAGLRDLYPGALCAGGVAGRLPNRDGGDGTTGVYWIPVYEILEARGFRVYLVNARHLKHVPGRKSDVKDCQWIQICTPVAS